MEGWASEPEDVGARAGTGGRALDQRPQAFVNRDGTAVDALAKWASMSWPPAVERLKGAATLRPGHRPVKTARPHGGVHATPPQSRHLD